MLWRHRTPLLLLALLVTLTYLFPSHPAAARFCINPGVETRYYSDATYTTFVCSVNTCDPFSDCEGTDYSRQSTICCPDPP
jgi:hypothetical protein